MLKLVQELDVVPRQYFRKLSGTGGIWECRVSFGGNTYRLLASFEGRNTLVLTDGFTKKTQKVPREEVDRASQLKADYLRRRA